MAYLPVDIIMPENKTVNLKRSAVYGSPRDPRKKLRQSTQESTCSTPKWQTIHRYLPKTKKNNSTLQLT